MNEEDQQHQQQPPAPAPPSATSGTGMEPNVAGVLCYLFSAVSGLIFYLIEKDDKTIRFHALQSILLGVAWVVLWVGLSIIFGVIAMIPGVNLLIFILVPIFVPVVVIGFWVVSIMLMVKAYQGEKWKLPIIGDIAEKNA